MCAGYEFAGCRNASDIYGDLSWVYLYLYHIKKGRAFLPSPIVSLYIIIVLLLLQVAYDKLAVVDVAVVGQCA